MGNNDDGVNCGGWFQLAEDDNKQVGMVGKVRSTVTMLMLRETDMML